MRRDSRSGESSSNHSTNSKGSNPSKGSRVSSNSNPRSSNGSAKRCSWEILPRTVSDEQSSKKSSETRAVVDGSNGLNKTTQLNGSKSNGADYVHLIPKDEAPRSISTSQPAPEESTTSVLPPTKKQATKRTEHEATIEANQSDTTENPTIPPETRKPEVQTPTFNTESTATRVPDETPDTTKSVAEMPALVKSRNRLGSEGQSGLSSFLDQPRSSQSSYKTATQSLSDASRASSDGLTMAANLDQTANGKTTPSPPAPRSIIQLEEEERRKMALADLDYRQKMAEMQPTRSLSAGHYPTNIVKPITARARSHTVSSVANHQPELSANSTNSTISSIVPYPAVYQTPAINAANLMEGYLRILPTGIFSKFRGGKRRYLSLNPAMACLFYWKHESRKNKGPAKCFNVITSARLAAPSSTTILVQYGGDGSVLTLKADSLQDCQRWLDAFNMIGQELSQLSTVHGDPQRRRLPSAYPADSEFSLNSATSELVGPIDDVQSLEESSSASAPVICTADKIRATFMMEFQKQQSQYNKLANSGPKVIAFHSFFSLVFCIIPYLHQPFISHTTAFVFSNRQPNKYSTGQKDRAPCGLVGEQSSPSIPETPFLSLILDF